MPATLKTCASHLADVRQALNHVGVWHLVSNDPAKTAAFARAWLEGTALRQDFDPLVVMLLETNKKASQLLAEDLREGSGVRCPFCLANRRFGAEHGDVAAKWIEDGAYLMLLTAKNNDLKVRTI